MTSGGPRVRAGRSHARGPVAVTGAGAVAAALRASLVAVGVDVLPIEPGAGDGTGGGAGGGAGAVVHLGWSDDRDEPWDSRRTRVVADTRGLLDDVVAGRLARLVVLTSTAVYGAAAGNAVPLPEDTPLPVPTLTEGPSGDLRAVEDLVATTLAAHPAADVTLLRPAGLLGCGDGGILAGHLASRRLLVVRGSAPCWQACHVDDLAGALASVLAAPPGALGGPAVVGCDGWLDQHELEQASGLTRWELPASVVEASASRLRRTRRAAAADELPFLTHSWVADGARLRELGWQPWHTNASAVRAHLQLDTVRPGPGADPDVERGPAAAGQPGQPAQTSSDSARRAAGATFAGATAAALGTAALVRRARRRRGR